MSDCTPDTHDWHYDAGRAFTTEVSRGDMESPHAGPFRVCSRCLIGHQLADIPASHPESMTADLGDDVEEMLAALDRLLFPKETLR
jgi:hypothetical protein